MITLEEQRDLLAKLKKAKSKLLKIRSVRGIAVGFKYKDEKIMDEISFIAYVSKKIKPRELIIDEQKLIPKEINGVSIDVIEVNPVHHSLQEEAMMIANPILGGVSIANSKLGGVGTVGGFAIDSDSGDTVGLTNYHVIVAGGLFGRSGKAGDHINQPALKPDTSEFNIGVLAKFNKRLDCACFKLATSRATDSQDAVNGISGKLGNTVEPLIGTPVKKTGAATGLTFGIISAISESTERLTITFNPSKMPADNRLSFNGDSGALWLTDDDHNNVIALHSGGDTNHSFAIGALHVQKALNISFTP